MVYLAGQILVFVLVAMLVGAALAWFFLIGPLRREGAARKSGQRDSVATTGRLDHANPAGSEAVVADLTARLRRQEDDWALERADLTARLATAEQQAAESERRVALAEHQVAEAERRVTDIDRQLRDVELRDADPSDSADSVSEFRVDAERGAGGDDGRRGGWPAPTVADLAQEARRLRDALADAEGRAAKFSSRLAMVRTEAEDAQRQVAIMITRLDRHQADWAAEKVRLLARIDDVEGRQAAAGRNSNEFEAQTASGYHDPEHGDPEHGDPEHYGDEATSDDTSDNRPHNLAPAAAPTVSEVDAEELVPASRASVGALPPPATATASPYPRTSALDAVVLSGGAERRPLPGSDALAGFVTTLRPGAVSVDVPAPARAVPVARATAAGRELARRSADNLKEIVGIGPLVEARLLHLGITSFRQLAAMGDADVDRLAGKLEGFGDRIVSDDWVGQARDLHSKRYGGLG